jgi:DNA polymerase-3 subunit gamma/tau
MAAPKPAPKPTPPIAPRPSGAVAAPPSPAAVAPAQKKPVARDDAAEDEWEAIVGRLAVEGLVRELAANCILKQRSDDAIQLVLGASHVHLHNAKFEKRLEQALQQHYNTALSLRVEVGEQPTHTPMQLAAQRDRERQRHAEAAIEGDSNVQAMREVFGAKIVPDSVYPVE